MYIYIYIYIGIEGKLGPAEVVRDFEDSVYRFFASDALLLECSVVLLDRLWSILYIYIYIYIYAVGYDKPDGSPQQGTGQEDCLAST